MDRLRLADIELDRLGVGALLIDDRLGVLLVGVGARVGAGALVGVEALAAEALELLELELFLELLATSTESTARTRKKMMRIPCT
jgi:hypothetical protein